MIKHLIMASCLFFTCPAVDDCALTGPYCFDDGHVMVLNNGSNGDTMNPGCDGCRVHVDVTIIWLHTGSGLLVDPEGDRTEIAGIQPFDSTSIVSDRIMNCNSQVEWDIFWDNGAQSGGGAVVANCLACE